MGRFAEPGGAGCTGEVWKLTGERVVVDSVREEQEKDEDTKPAMPEKDRCCGGEKTMPTSLGREG